MNHFQLHCVAVTGVSIYTQEIFLQPSRCSRFAMPMASISHVVGVLYIHEDL